MASFLGSIQKFGLGIENGGAEAGGEAPYGIFHFAELAFEVVA